MGYTDFEHDKVHWDVILAVIGFVCLLAILFAVVGTIVELLKV